MEKLPLYKAVGRRGSWFAEANGELLPCFHKYWLKGLLHHSKRGGGSVKHRGLIDAISADPRVIVTTDRVAGDGDGFERTGYVAIYEIADIDADDDEIRFRLTKKIADLK